MGSQARMVAHKRGWWLTSADGGSQARMSSAIFFIFLKCTSRGTEVHSGSSATGVGEALGENVGDEWDGITCVVCFYFA